MPMFRRSSLARVLKQTVGAAPQPYVRSLLDRSRNLRGRKNVRSDRERNLRFAIDLVALEGRYSGILGEMTLE